MPDPCLALTLRSLPALRAATLAGPAANNARLAEGVYLSWDEDEGEVALDLSHSAGSLLRIDGTVARRPRWLSLNLDLGSGRLAPGDALALVTDAEADAALSLPLAIRARTGDRLSDTTWQTPLAVGPGRRVSALFQHLAPDDAPADAAPFRTLILNLPKTDFRLAIHDLRLFRVPADRARRDDAFALGDAAL